MASKTKPWNACDFVLLFFLCASIITLICTCTLVWNPYLQTSSFYWGNCRVISITSAGYTTCTNQKINQCIEPPSTLPPSWFNYTIVPKPTTPTTAAPTTITETETTTPTTTLHPSSPNSTINDNTYQTDSTSVTETETTTTTSTLPPTELILKRRRRKRDNENYCISFPCVVVSVSFSNNYIGPTIARANMSNTYNDLAQYPQCSISSCGGDNEDNFQKVYDFTEQMFNYKITAYPFYCYLNYNNYSQSLYHVNGSYGAAVSSIFWPIVGLICFFFGFLMYRFRGCMDKSSRSPPPNYDASYGVGPGGQVTFVGVDGVRVVENDYAIGGYANPVASADGEKNPASLGEEIGGARPDATTPPPMGFAQPPAYLTISPDGQYNFPPAARMPAVPGAEIESGATRYVEPSDQDATQEKY